MTSEAFWCLLPCVISYSKVPSSLHVTLMVDAASCWLHLPLNEHLGVVQLCWLLRLEPLPVFKISYIHT